MKVSLKTKPVSTLLYNLKKGKISLEYPIQRQTGQWTRKIQSELIDSLFREFIVPPLCFNVEEISYDLDGVQRLSVINDYINNGFSLSKDLKPVVIDGTEYIIAGKKFKQLPEELQEMLKSAPIYVYEITNATEEEIYENYRRLNNGKPLNKAQKLTVCMDVETNAAIQKIMRHPFLKKTGMTAGDFKGDNTRSIACQILMLVGKYEFTDFRAPSIEKFAYSLNDNKEETLRLIDHVLAILDELDSKIEEKIPAMKKLSIPMVVIAMDHVMGDAEREKAYLEWLAEFFENYSSNEAFLKFCGKNTASNENVMGRLNYFLNAVD
mgnify:FL=1